MSCIDDHTHTLCESSLHYDGRGKVYGKCSLCGNTLIIPLDEITGELHQLIWDLIKRRLVGRG